MAALFISLVRASYFNLEIVNGKFCRDRNRVTEKGKRFRKSFYEAPAHLGVKADAAGIRLRNA